ncbi:unnamed protein product [Rotaria sp. Silwood1]|nr:unnamed protein product [Rotaria sp. Silwood1]CAF3675642.1 unnamed protein product [Rotaria sp. Silwood1]CAF4725907.1 unnamed protein product [Rotaria sp. Silwood1]CAF4895984.1 unnamed protein product [Rotaria sp. Silwood1]
MEDLITSLIKFDGTRNQDVVKWLQYIQEIFNRVQLQASYNYIAVHYFLTNDAATWFRHTEANIPDWFTFKREIIEAFPSSSSSFSSHLLDHHQLTIKEEPQKLGQEQDVLHAPTSCSTMSNKTLDNDNTSFNSVNDNRIDSFEDLESEHLRKCESGHYSHMLVTINDLDLNIQSQGAYVADDYDQLEQQGASAINSDSVKIDVEDTLEGFTRTMDNLTANHSLINTVLPRDVQY